MSDSEGQEDGHWAAISETNPSDETANKFLTQDFPVSALIDLEEFVGFRTPVLKRACATWQREGGIVETVALEYDEQLQKAYNLDSMGENVTSYFDRFPVTYQGQSDMVEAANTEIDDSEDYEYFYDWLMQQCIELTTASKQRIAPFFVRYVRLQTQGSKILN